MAAADEGALLAVVVACSPRAGEVDVVDLQLPPGATVRDAVQASGLQARHPALDFSALALGVWGAARQGADLLRDGDRVELYRPLVVEPMAARRRRQAAQSRRKGSGVSGR